MRLVVAMNKAMNKYLSRVWDVLWKFSTGYREKELSCGCKYYEKKENVRTLTPCGWYPETKVRTMDKPSHVLVNAVKRVECDFRGASFIERTYSVPVYRCERCGDRYLVSGERSLLVKERVWINEVGGSS